MKRPRQLLSLEEHYYSNAVFSSLDERVQRTLEAVPGLVDQLVNVGEERLASMDRGDITLQVISHAFTSGGPSPDTCRRGNNQLARAILSSCQPTRFAAFAVLPVADPAASALELHRCVSQLGFVGALIDNHADGTHYDATAYAVLWAKACELDVPIYLHPTWPSAAMGAHYAGNYPNAVSTSLGGPGWGWHADVGLHVLKLFAAGVFDMFPSLKIILGHMGEMLPFMLERCIEMSKGFAGGWGPRVRPLRQVWDENIWITTSGAWSVAPMRCILANTRVERIMYSVDYPFESNEKGRRWFEQLEESGLLSREELEMVAHGNAEKLLRVQLPRCAPE
ncbi:amidohydrolase 2 [Bimuria novae-zelandiae CBS 107.79]|uniref:Amidohydrolase 2 n=1 Tax=Bimuria novae-zelandiae CBS 107.79 TaxID=1447943 RepID=A0A6A5V6Z1_9PLEO|nr:amidohydrolase 2 [Bimuria novae-zelandiae CBS 107.79]